MSKHRAFPPSHMDMPRRTPDMTSSENSKKQLTKRIYEDRPKEGVGQPAEDYVFSAASPDLENNDANRLAAPCIYLADRLAQQWKAKYDAAVWSYRNRHISSSGLDEETMAVLELLDGLRAAHDQRLQHLWDTMREIGDLEAGKEMVELENRELTEGKMEGERGV